MVEVLPNRVQPEDPAFVSNRDGLLTQLAELEQQLAQTRAGGGEKYVARHRKRGKLLPRERIELLIDADSAFLELSPFAAWAASTRSAAASSPASAWSAASRAC